MLIERPRSNFSVSFTHYYNYFIHQVTRKSNIQNNKCAHKQKTFHFQCLPISPDANTKLNLIKLFRIFYIFIFKQIQKLMNEETKQVGNEVEMPQLALRSAQFFMTLGYSCLQYYHKYKQEKQRKTKLIKKNTKKPRQKLKLKNDNDNPEDEASKKLPKKPLTAYIIYFQEKKPKFVDKHPGLNLSELTKLIAKQWKQINDDERKPYLDQAHEQRKRYQRQLQQFRSKYGVIKEIDQSNPSSQEIESFIEEEEKQEDAVQPQAQKMENESEEDQEDDEQKKQSNENVQ